MKKRKRDKWISQIDSKIDPIDSYSWFNICETFNEKQLDCEKIDTNSTNITCSWSNRLFPTEIQSEVLRKWLDITRRMYNITTKFIRKNIYVNGKINNKKVAEFINFRRLRTKYLKNEKAQLSIDRINSHILDQAIQRCVTMYKGCLTKYKKNKHFEFRVRTIKKQKRYHSFDIEKILFSKVKNGFCTNVFGEIKSERSIMSPERGCVLSYDRYTSKYILHMPKTVVTESTSVNNLNCGIDPGIRTFLTVYSKNDVLEIGKNINYNKYFDKIDSLNSHFDVNDENKNKQCMKYKKAIGKIYDKINNRTKDMHFKVAKLLCQRYKKIKIGKFSTKDLVKNVSSKLAAKTKRLLYALSHYKFRSILEHQGKKYGVKILTVSEYNTTKMCSSCGKLNNPDKSKIYKCNCGLLADRDVNAAKNIRYVM